MQTVSLVVVYILHIYSLCYCWRIFFEENSNFDCLRKRSSSFLSSWLGTHPFAFRSVRILQDRPC